jgi:FkbM family methyltransferase
MTTILSDVCIRYGANDTWVDVTGRCVDQFLTHDGIIYIPSTDLLRAHYFTDPLGGVRKKISISLDHGVTWREYDDKENVTIDLIRGEVNSVSEAFVDESIASIHRNLRVLYGHMQDELSEQKMSVRFLTGKEKVLEIGGNVGRNSLIIASVLLDPNNLLVLESDPTNAQLLIQNRDANNLSFRVIDAALSARQLIQSGWETKPSDVLQRGYFWVKTLTYDKVREIHDFDTLVLDCEGAFYYILRDSPEILDGVEFVLMENDYNDPAHKEYVDEVLQQRGFRVIYREALDPCLNSFPHVRDKFYEAWRRFS